jgi:predicted regulator of Ras-like GTPase activity (Roadblock/LC7/MglB family)
MSAFPSHLTRLAERAAQALLSSIDGSIAVVIATADGFDVARAGSVSIDASRLAAMMSSLSALGEAASKESGIGSLSCLVVECTEGRLVVRCVQFQGHSLVFVVLTGGNVLLGMVWNRLGEASSLMDLA